VFNGQREYIVRVKRSALSSYWYAPHVGEDFVVLDSPADVDSYPLKVDQLYVNPRECRRYIRKRDCIIVATA
jgi:hypothetical protein